MNSTITCIEGLRAGNVLTGFYLPVGSKEYFFVTDRKNKTAGLAADILRALQLPDAPRLRAEVLYFVRAASIEMKRTARGRSYYNIYGEGFGGRGSDNVDDGKTVVIEL